MIYHTRLRKCQESFDVTSWRRQLCYFLMSCRDWCSSPTRGTQTCNHRWVVCLLQAWGMASSRFCICSFSAMGLFNLTQNRTLTKKKWHCDSISPSLCQTLDFCDENQFTFTLYQGAFIYQTQFAKLSRIQPVVRYDKLPCPSGSVSNPTFPKAKSKLASGRSCLRLGRNSGQCITRNVCPW